MKYIGIDGCRTGWFFVGISDNDSFRAGVVPEISAIKPWLEEAVQILVDIPIGLLSSGSDERLCDVAARRLISPRGSTVFPAPARTAVYKDSYAEASDENQRCLGRRLSKQSFHICKKIREVDEFVRTVRPGPKLREMHPEVAFCTLGGMSPRLTRKKEPDGYRDRLGLLRSVYPGTDELIEAAREGEPFRKNLADDDILDALVGAVTARLYRSLETLPDTPPTDDAGLPMEIVYARRAAL
jgi:predicted RNase H-like nuclease